MSGFPMSGSRSRGCLRCPSGQSTPRSSPPQLIPSNRRRPLVPPNQHRHRAPLGRHRHRAPPIQHRHHRPDLRCAPLPSAGIPRCSLPPGMPRCSLRPCALLIPAPGRAIAKIRKNHPPLQTPSRTWEESSTSEALHAWMIPHKFTTRSTGVDDSPQVQAEGASSGPSGDTGNRRPRDAEPARRHARTRQQRGRSPTTSGFSDDHATSVAIRRGRPSLRRPGR